MCLALSNSVGVTFFRLTVLSPSVIFYSRVRMVQIRIRQIITGWPNIKFVKLEVKHFTQNLGVT